MNSIVSEKARIGRNCRIGDFVKIHDNVTLGDDCIIEDFCILGYPCPAAKQPLLAIGPNSHIRSHSVFYEGSEFGEGLSTGSHVTVRENITAGEGLRIGTKSDIQGYTTFGRYVMIHSQVHVAKEATIGDFVWLFPRVTFTDDPLPPSFLQEGITIDEMAVVAANALLLPGIRIGAGAFIGAGSVVKTDVPPVTVVHGNPAKPACRLRDLNLLRDNAGYPWSDHFHKRYPEAAQKLLHETGERIRALMQLS